MATVVITGASGGIGQEFAIQYARAGHTVVATARHTTSPLEAALSPYGSARLATLDVGSQASILAFSKEIADMPVDILINNAAMGDAEPAAQFGSLEMRQGTAIMAVNILGPLKLTETLLANLLAADSAKVVMISSDMGSLAMSNGGSHLYRASKAGLNAVTHALGLDLKARGITVTAVHPGSVQTRMGGFSAADLTPTDAVSAMRATIERIEARHAGAFINLHGEPLPW